MAADSHAGEHSPNSRNATIVAGENAVAAGESGTGAGPAAQVEKLKLLVSYGGKILPRVVDSGFRYVYVGGDTKILSLERAAALRFTEFSVRAGALAGVGEVAIKYQVPGEDLDSLVSVINDEDLSHLVYEYDRILARRPGSTPRIRVFLFALGPAAATALQMTMIPSDLRWFIHALNSAVPLPPFGNSETLVPTLKSEPARSAVSPDYLFGLEDDCVQPQPVNPSKDLTDPPSVEIPISVADLVVEDKNSPVSEPSRTYCIPADETQRQIQVLEQQLHVDAPMPSPATIPRKDSNEALVPTPVLPLSAAMPPPPPPPPECMVPVPKCDSDENQVPTTGIPLPVMPPVTFVSVPANYVPLAPPADHHQHQEHHNAEQPQHSPTAPPAMRRSSKDEPSSVLPLPVTTAAAFVPMPTSYTSLPPGAERAPFYIIPSPPGVYPPFTAVYAMPPLPPQNMASPSPSAMVSAAYFTNVMPSHSPVTGLAGGRGSPKSTIPVKPAQVIS